MKRTTIVQIITYLFVILFVYTALSKWFLYDVYIKDLHRSPELGPFALPISIIIPASELVVAGLLLYDRTRLLGLYGALVLMTMFTLYVGWVLTFSTRFPCSCGGIIKELTWTNHMIFNVCFTMLAVLGIYLQKKINKTPGGEKRSYEVNMVST